jgi:hypothetical protein
MKRVILNLLVGILLFPMLAFSYSEDNRADEIIEELAKNSKWEEVLSNAHFLILESPYEAGGYYYMAFAYHHLEMKSKAKTYIKHAKRLKDKNLAYKISQLEFEMGMRKSMPDSTGLCETSSDIRIPKPKDRFYFSYDFHQSMPIGISMGNLRPRGVGSYMAVRSNQGLFTATNGFEVRGNGKAYESDAGFEPTGITRTGSIEGIMGLTWKLIGPLWMYSGAGLNHSRVFYEMENPEENPNLTSWAKSPQNNLNVFALESGLIMNLKGVNLKIGTVMTDFDYNHLRVQVGLGFSLVQK